jgi:hypothetical protein
MKELYTQAKIFYSNIDNDNSNFAKAPAMLGTILELLHLYPQTP